MTPNTYYIFFQRPLDKEQKNLSKIHPLQGNQVPASIADRNRDLPTWKQIGFVLTFNFSAFYVHQAQHKSQCFRAQYLSRSARPPVFYLPSFCMLQQLRPLHISPALLVENKSIWNRVTCSVGYRAFGLPRPNPSWRSIQDFDFDGKAPICNSIKAKSKSFRPTPHLISGLQQCLHGLPAQHQPRSRLNWEQSPWLRTFATWCDAPQPLCSAWAMDRTIHQWLG